MLGNTPDTGGTWSPVLASGTNIFNPSLDTTGIYTYTISNVCGTASPAAQINVTVNQTPIIDTPTAVQVCDSFTFSMITGMNLSGNEAYYTMTNGGGTQYNNGDVFTPALAGAYTFFLYDETGTTPNCIDEVSFTVTVTSTPIIDVIANPIDQCDNFTLPNITGSNLTGNEAFYTYQMEVEHNILLEQYLLLQQRVFIHFMHMMKLEQLQIVLTKFLLTFL